VVLKNIAMRYRSLLIFAFLICRVLNAQLQSEADSLFAGSDPSFSHNGRFIGCEHNRRIWVIDLKTNEKKQISTLSWDFRPKWSPNDKQIVFQSFGDSIDYEKRHRFSIWIVNIDGTNQHKLIEEMKSGDQSPYWSPDGKKIAWTHGKQLWISDNNGLHSKLLTKVPAIEWEYIVDWSKDSKTILYLRRDSYSDGTGYQICLIDTNSQNQKRIEIIKNIGCAKFAQDGISICYIPDGNHLCKYYIATSKILKNILEIKNMNNNGSFDFSPDFKSITFDNSGPDVEPNVYIMKIK
jgi:Tol biopolymer transport system component